MKLKKEIDELRTSEIKTSNEINELNPEKIEEHIEKHNKLLEKQSELNSETLLMNWRYKKTKQRLLDLKKRLNN
jgi:hypothetical protein